MRRLRENFLEGVLQRVVRGRLLLELVPKPIQDRPDRQVGPRDEDVVRFLDFNTRARRTVATLEKPYDDLGVSPDGLTILYGQIDSYGSDLMLVENFR